MHRYHLAWPHVQLAFFIRIYFEDSREVVSSRRLWKCQPYIRRRRPRNHVRFIRELEAQAILRCPVTIARHPCNHLESGAYTRSLLSST